MSHSNAENSSFLFEGLEVANALVSVGESTFTNCSFHVKIIIMNISSFQDFEDGNIRILFGWTRNLHNS